MKPFVWCIVVFGMSMLVAGGQEKQGQNIADRFDKDSEHWHIYDFSGGPGNKDIFRPVTWEKSGGVNNSGYVWADDSRWSIDTPEKPHSILALIHYRRWEQPAIDYVNKPLAPERLEAFFTQVQDFIDAIRHKRLPAVTGEEGRACIRLIDAVRKSSVTGQAVSLG